MQKNLKDALKIYIPFAVVALIFIIIALRFVAPAPPKEINFAAGSANGQYYAIAKAYAEALEPHGIAVNVLETEGTLTNYSLLASGEADLALLQGGIADGFDTSELRALGGMFAEPFWLFTRTGTRFESFADLQTATIAAGETGSGTLAQLNWLRSEWGGNWQAAEFLPLSGQDALQALRASDIDVAVFSAAIETPYIQAALRDSSLTLAALKEVDALSMRNQALTVQTLYRGVVDLDSARPSQDTKLLASIAQIGVRADLHPAIQSVLLETAETLHSDGTLLTRAGTYPDLSATELTLSDEARRYARNGPTFLRSYFSFGWANFLERAWVFLIPLIAFLIPLVQMAPPIYRWRTRRKIYLWYHDLHDLERRGFSAKTTEERDTVLDEIHKLQIEVGLLDVPVSYNDELYHLRSHINFVEALISRQKLIEAI